MSRIVYGILCNNSAEYVQEQYQLLYTPDTYFIYHVDEKAPARLKDFLARSALANNNLSVIPSLLCSWAGYSLTQAMLNIMTAALGLHDWDHLVFLSELHLPLQSQQHIARTLEPNHNYIEKLSYTSFYEAGKTDIFNRTAQIYREVPGVGAFGTKLREPPPGFTERLHHGSQWMTLCRTTCAQLQQAGDNADLEVFKDSVLSGENAIQSCVSQLSNDAVTNVGRIITYVADPSRGGSEDMTFDEHLFFSARDKGYLFIRKRTATLSPRIRSYLDEISPRDRRPEKLPVRSVPPAFNEALATQSLINCLNEKCKRSDFQLLPIRQTANAPNLFCKAQQKDLQRPFGIYLVSQDLLHFKVLAIISSHFTGFVDATIGGYRTSVVRARLADISFNREIHLAEDLDFGFYTVRELADLDGLIELISTHIFRTTRLNSELQRDVA